ncbi:hypothetical protein HZS_594, partial [Henneguya salminicola]
FLGLLTRIKFLAHPLIETLIYIWSRKNPHAQVNLFGLITFPAPWFPYISVLLSLITNQGLKSDLVAILTGHLYFYLEEVYPLRFGGVQIVKTPYFV